MVRALFALLGLLVVLRAIHVLQTHCTVLTALTARLYTNPQLDDDPDLSVIEQAKALQSILKFLPWSGLRWAGVRSNNCHAAFQTPLHSDQTPTHQTMQKL